MNPVPSDSPDSAAAHRTPVLSCRLCGSEHRRVPLGRGERAHCTRCGTLLERRSWLGTDAGLAFALTGAALAVPALTLPFITVAKLGREHVGLALTGAVALWEAGMRLLAVWVALCGAVTPVVMLVALTTVLVRARVGRHHVATQRWRRIAHIVEHWAMPEVHVLAVLVAMIKLGDLVHVQIGAGFWCYVAMSIALLLAWRGFDLEPLGPALAPRKPSVS